jgi:hypothetical protein
LRGAGLRCDWKARHRSESGAQRSTVGSPTTRETIRRR